MALANLLGIRIGAEVASEVSGRTKAESAAARLGESAGNSAGSSSGKAKQSPTQNLFVTAQSLTFSGVTLVGGVVLNFLTANIGGTRLWVALGVAVVLGLIVTAVAIATPHSSWTGAPNKLIAVVIALVNTFVLWISLFGISSIPNMLVGTSPN